MVQTWVLPRFEPRLEIQNLTTATDYTIDLSDKLVRLGSFSRGERLRVFYTPPGVEEVGAPWSVGSENLPTELTIGSEKLTIGTAPSPVMSVYRAPLQIEEEREGGEL